MTFPAMRRDEQLIEGQTTLSTFQAVEERFICMTLSLYQIGRPEKKKLTRSIGGII
jgi:hypothetical protein